MDAHHAANVAQVQLLRQALKLPPLQLPVPDSQEPDDTLEQASKPDEVAHH